MWKMSVLAVLVLTLAWGLFSWRWYTCGVKGVCDEARAVSFIVPVEADTQFDTDRAHAVVSDFKSM